jgi:hypothetical protein
LAYIFTSLVVHAGPEVLGVGVAVGTGEAVGGSLGGDENISAAAAVIADGGVGDA